MSFIYADNFRGFSKCVIPLDGICFFVGENSTGKTSLLALINLLHSHSFWFNKTQFNSTDYEFGGFEDIVSADANASKNFTIGIANKYKNKDQPEMWNCVLTSYAEVDGLPSLEFAAQLKNNVVTCLHFKADILNFTQIKLEAPANERTAEEVFAVLESYANGDKSEYSEGNKILLGVPLFPLFSLITAFAEKREIKGDNFFDDAISVPKSMTWLAPIRTQPRRTYDGYGKDFSPDGEHTPYELRKLLKDKAKAKAFKKALREFGKSSGLFSDVGIHNMGRGAASPFELLIKLSASPLKIHTVGYGVSQALPVVVEMIVREKQSWIVVQQPEVHLHPRAQAALGDVIFEMARNEDKKFIIETHSDFLIDRFRLALKTVRQHKIVAKVFFFERHNEGNKFSIVEIKSNGEYSENQPETFRKFFIHENLNLIGI